jgi:methylamine dehydrogenase heavy chain
VRGFVILSLLIIGQADLAQGGAEQMTIATLPAQYEPHWVWVNDMALGHVADGKAILVDADTGTYLGQLDTGGFFMKLELPDDAAEIYSASTFFTRVNRGERTDVVTIFDPSTLSPVDEIIIPPKRKTGMATLAHSALTDEQRFMLVFNMTPAQSVSVVDMHERKFAGEIATPGCALVYPSGVRRFHMLCGDGSLLTVGLNEDGTVESKSQSKPFFDPWQDPVTEKSVRWKDQWLYVSFENVVHPVDVSGDAPKFLPTWSLITDEDRAEEWRSGGVQYLALHEKRGLLFSLMHKGGLDTHKDPGKEIWVYDLRTKKRVNRFKLKGIASSIQVTQDDEPLLLTAFVGIPNLTVYDPDSGERLRTIKKLGSTISLLQTN